jgi:hypothetical protein
MSVSPEHLDAIPVPIGYTKGRQTYDRRNKSWVADDSREHTHDRKILLLRVGRDSGFGGLGPLFPDGTFEYVPIPEDPNRVSERSLFFHDIPARSGGSVARFVPAKHKKGTAHYDPEFGAFTYGNPSRNKRGQLLRLDTGDILVFNVGLRPPEMSHGSKLYIVGYLTIQQAHAITSLFPWPPTEHKHLWGNAHFRRSRGVPRALLSSRVIQQAADCWPKLNSCPIRSRTSFQI